MGWADCKLADMDTYRTIELIDFRLEHTAHPRMEVSRGSRLVKREWGGYSSFCLCAKLLAWIKVLGFPPLMPSVFIVWVTQISEVSEFNSLSLSVLSLISYFCTILSLCSLCSLSHLSSSCLLYLCLHRSLGLSSQAPTASQQPFN